MGATENPPRGGGEPLVTIGIPTFNYGRYLGEAIGSALGQGYRRIEVVVCDNASTDDTADVVAAFRDPRLRYVRHPRNIGLYPNCNACLAEARPEARYFKLLPADDVLEPGFVERTVSAAEAAGAALVLTSYANFGNDTRTFLAPPWPRGARVAFQPAEIPRHLRTLSFAVVPTANLFRLDAARAAGGYTPGDAGSLASDFGLWLRLVDAGATVLLNEPLCRIRVHALQARSARDSTRALTDSLEALSAYRGRDPRDPARRRGAVELMAHLAEPFLWQDLSRLARGRLAAGLRTARLLSRHGILLQGMSGWLAGAPRFLWGRLG